jgi:hypothetical protein
MHLENKKSHQGRHKAPPQRVVIGKKAGMVGFP